MSEDQSDTNRSILQDNILIPAVVEYETNHIKYKEQNISLTEISGNFYCEDGLEVQHFELVDQQDYYNPQESSRLGEGVRQLIIPIETPQENE